MTTAALKSLRRQAEFGLPAWVGKLDPARFRIERVVIRGATFLTPEDMERRTAAAYEEIARQIDGAPRRYPVRVWNFIPGIHASAGVEVDRYMVFNAGRFAACRQWLGDDEGFEKHLPTASAVGHEGEDLIVYALAADEPGTAIENPRQVPAYRYSTRYGPRPPCFSRATLLKDMLLVGGTASIVGEDSSGLGDLGEQMRQTLENLSSLIERGLGKRGDALTRLLDARAYYVRPEDKASIGQMLKKSFGGLKRLEMVRADLCRRELLVEIEGIAR